MQKWLKICHDGRMMYVDMPDSTEDPSYPFLNAVHREIDCDLIEIVRVAGFDFMCPTGTNPIIIIDECGKLKKDPELRINNLCTLGYAPGLDCIIGDALLGRQVGPEILPLTQEQYDHFVQCIEEIFTNFQLVREDPK